MAHAHHSKAVETLIHPNLAIRHESIADILKADRMERNDHETRQYLEARAFYAKLLAASGRSSDPRIEQAFRTVPREHFLPPGPWRIFVGNRLGEAYIETPSADPIHLYQNVLVALDEKKGLNNGQPSLHATWFSAVLPKPGEDAVHIGAGRGYYSAILSALVSPNGSVTAYEIDKRLALAAREHLARFERVRVVNTDAVTSELPKADVIYVNAGITSLPLKWIQALRLGGRLIFPWRPKERIGVALLLTKREIGIQVDMIGFASFVSCIGASDEKALSAAPDVDAVRQIRSLQLTSQQKPDDSAVVIYKNIWFSRADISDPSSGCGH